MYLSRFKKEEIYAIIIIIQHLRIIDVCNLEKLIWWMEMKNGWLDPMQTPLYIL